MKPFQDYIFSLNKVYEYRIKIAGTNPKGEVMERIKNALDAFQIETIGTPRSVPIQEHRDFPKLGPCETWVFEVTVKYPTTSNQMRQMIIGRAAIGANSVCVYTKNEDDFNEEAEALGKDRKVAALTTDELESNTDGQSLVGSNRIESMLKELTKGTPPGLEKRPAAQKAEANAESKSPIGSTQNKITRAPTTSKGKK